ncbi:MAG: winged helix-turn-helix domain-containing protein [Planctomycetaceae bacterium]
MTTRKTPAKKTTTKKTPSGKRAASKRTPGKNAPTKDTTAKKAAAKKTPAIATEKKLSAIDAAAKVLGETDKPLNAKEIIEAMSAKQYWTSPGGKTPHATLYSAILREIQKKGDDARFRKAERGRFTLANNS